MLNDDRLNGDRLNALAETALRSIPQQPHATSLSASAFECKPWRSSGFSDCEIYQLTCEHGTFAIRSWPNRIDTPSKVDFWTTLNANFASPKNDLTSIGAANSTPFPALFPWSMPSERSISVLPSGGLLWTLSNWVSGASMNSSVVDRSLVQHLARVLARIHATTRTAVHPNGLLLGRQTMQSSSLRFRLDILQLLDHRLFPKLDQSAFFSQENLADKMKHCVATVLERKCQWDRFLNICVAQERECHWIVRDLWRENILLDSSDRFASIVDLGASRMDWPGLDFIRLFGSLEYGPLEYGPLEYGPLGSVFDRVHPSGDLWQDAYDAYVQENCEHAISSLDECKMLHLVSSGLSVVQWAIWGTDGTLEAAHSDKAKRIAQRIRELSDRFLLESA